MTIATLPNLVTLDSCDGDWKSYLEAVYNIFLEEVVHAKLSFLNMPIACQYRPATEGKHFGFWHLISQGESEDERVPDLRRCERIRWISHIIKNAHSTEIKCWENKRGANRHIVLWLPQKHFIVVLAKRKDYLMLKTAYPHHERKAAKFRKELEGCLDPRNG